MKLNKIALLSLTALLTLAGCQTNDVSSSNSSTSTPPFTSENEVEEFNDPIIKENMLNLLKGFSISGNVIQKRYQAGYVNGSYIPVGDPIEENTYFTDISFNSGSENAFYKHSYQYIDNEKVTAEGPYVFFEDEDGYAYSEEINYANEIVKTYDTSVSSSTKGLTFADNGFYNFFKIFIEEDFTLNNNVSSYTRYDLNVDKVGIVTNNLLYSLNTGAYALPTEAYIRVDNGVFSQMFVTLAATLSYDSMSGTISMITNEISFTFSNIGQETIKHVTPYEENNDANNLTNALAKFKDSSFKMRVTNQYSANNMNLETTEEFSEIFDYYFTNREIYVHKVLENETSDINLENDYYLAPLSDADNTLYPYMYDENSQSYQLVENGVTDSEGNILFASGYNGKYVYSDLCPIISGVSGALFTFNSENNVYTVLQDAKSSLNDCFLIDKQPFKIDGFEEAQTFTLTLDKNSDLSTLDADYAFVDTMNAIIYNGTINVTFTDLNNISLDDIINQ